MAQRQKTKKTVAQLWEELAKNKKRIAVVYIPLICEGMRDENPNMDYMDIKDQVVSKAVEEGWNEPYIVRCLPSWIVEADPDRDFHHLRSLKSHENRNKEALNQMQLKVASLTEEPLPEPPEPKEPEEPEYIEGGRLTEIGDTGTIISEQLRTINGGCVKLFEGLTDKKYMPHGNDDLINDHVKPTREFRQKLLSEIDGANRRFLSNNLVVAVAVAQDMLELLEKETS